MAANNAINSAYTSTTSWTPSLQFGGAAVGLTYSTQTGSYVKLGNLLYFRCTLVLTAKGSSTGSALITGLPVSTEAVLSTVFDIRVSNVNFTGSCDAFAPSSNITMALTDENLGAVVSMDDTNFTNTSSIEISGCYISSS